MTEQIPLIEGMEVYSSQVQPREQEIYLVAAYHGFDKRWKVFVPQTNEKWGQSEGSAREFAERLPHCWVAWRIIRVVLE